MAWLSNWAHRIELTGDSVKIEDTLEHAAATIFLGESVGQDGDDTTCVFDRLTSDSNRKKIALTKANGTTQIYVEIEYWDTSSEFAVLHASKSDLELLSTEDPKFFLYYDPAKADNTAYVGDTTETPAQNVWDPDYCAVHHLAGEYDGTAGEILDSTSNARHGTASGDPTRVAGPHNFAQQLDGNDYLDLTDIDDLEGVDVLTVSCFAAATSGQDANRIIGGEDRLQLVLDSDSHNYVRFRTGSSLDGGTFDSEIGTDGTFHHINVAYNNGSTVDLVFDGVVDAQTPSCSGNTPSETSTIKAGRKGDATGNNFTGSEAEIRFSKVYRSHAWRKFEFYSLDDDFFTFGPEEAYADYGVARGMQTLSLSVADLTGSFELRSSLGTGGILDLITTLPMYGEQALRLKMSDDLLQVLRLCASGDQGVQNLLAGMGISREQALRFQLGTFAAGAQALRNLISGDPAQAAQVLRGVIDENNRVVGMQNLLLALKDVEALFPNIPYSISIDGKPIRDRFISASVTYSQDSVHNAITIVSSDFDLYSLADPDSLPGEQRIELQVGSRVLYFMIEERSGGDRQWSIWGRSLSAREDVPHAKEISYTQDEPESASSVAENLCTTCVVDWVAPVWVLPEDFEFFGSPLEGVKQIASAIEAVVRSQDDGSITVRRRYPVRPVDLATASPAVTYSVEREVIELGYRRITGYGYNAVTVNGYSPEVFLPDLEAEETNPIQGTDVHVRAYWAGQIPAAPPTVYVTAGSVIKLADGLGEQTDRVVFSGGVGELSYPPEEISSVSWIGANGGNVAWEKHVKTLGISATEPRLATITYTTQFSRYRLYGHDVPELVFTMVVSPGQDVSVRVRMGIGDREALEINEPLLTAPGIAVERGRAFLDDSSYRADEIDLSAPYEDAAVDGAVICLEVGGLHLSGNALILEAGIEIAGPRVTNRLRVRQWQVSLNF